MSKGKKLAALILVLVLMIGGYLLVRNMGETDDGAAQDSAASAVSVAQSDAALASAITVGGEDGYRIEKSSDGVWRDPQNESLELDQTAADSAAALLSNISASYALDEGHAQEKLNDYGLDSPSLTMTLGLSDGTEQTYLVGMQNPVTQEYYFLPEGGDTVYLVDKSYYTSFCDGVVSFAQVETLPALSENSLTDISLTWREDSGKDDVHFVYYPDGTDEIYNFSEFWFYDSPQYGLMSMDTATFNKDYVPVITGISFDHPVAVANEETLREYGFDSPLVNIRYSYADASSGESGTVSILVSDACEQENQRYVVLEGGQYIYRMGQSSIMNPCDVLPETYVTPIALPIDLSTIESVDVVLPDKTYTVDYVMTKSAEETGTPTFDYYCNGELLDEDSAYNWRVFFNNMRVEYADKISFNLGEFDDSSPVIRIVVHRNTETFQTLTLSFYKYDASFYAADFDGLRVQLFDKNFVTDWVQSVTGVLN